MGSRIREHVRSNVVGYIALFCFAIGGTAYATHPGGTNTISSGDIINGDVRSPDIGSNEVRSGDVANDDSEFALRSVDLAADSVTGSEIAESAVGTPEIAFDAVLEPQIAADAVGTSEVASSAVRGSEIATNAVQTDEIEDGTVTSADIATGAVTTGDISDASLTYGRVSAGGGISRSKGLTVVGHPEPGVYCLAPLEVSNPSDQLLIVSADSFTSSTNPADSVEDVSVVQWRVNRPNCGANTLEVNTFVYDGDPIDQGGSAAKGDDLRQADQPFTFVVLP